MRHVFILVVAAVTGWLGWWLGSFSGVSLAFVLGAAGSFAGVYIGWRIKRDYLG